MGFIQRVNIPVAPVIDHLTGTATSGPVSAMPASSDQVVILLLRPCRYPAAQERPHGREPCDRFEEFKQCAR